MLQRRLVGNPLAEQKTVALLKQSPLPVSIEYVARTLGVNWATARAILLTLLADRRIKGQKTTKSWIFWLKKKLIGAGSSAPQPRPRGPPKHSTLALRSVLYNEEQGSN